MIDLFLKAIDKGIQLAYERGRQRKLFFDDVVTPIHSEFEKMYNQHIATFQKTRELLLNKQTTYFEISSYVDGRILFEGGNTALLSELTRYTDNPFPPPKKEKDLGELYRMYVAAIGSCLGMDLRKPRMMTIRYYAELRGDIVQALFKTDTNEVIKESDRDAALVQLEGLIVNFNMFYAEVSRRYMELQRYCSA